MKKYLLGSFAMALAIGFSAFKTYPEKVNAKFADLYYYQYVGPDQDPSSRANKANYQNPSSSTYTCSGTGNECEVRVSLTGTPPSDLTTLNVTFDPTTGFPIGGTNFNTNIQKH